MIELDVGMISQNSAETAILVMAKFLSKDQMGGGH